MVVGLLSIVCYCCHAYNPSTTVSIVTGGSGFLGREIIHTLLQDVVQESITRSHSTLHLSQQQQPPAGATIISLVRPSRVAFEQRYWSHQDDARVCPVKVMPYDMLDGGISLQNALNVAFQDVIFNRNSEDDDDEDDYVVDDNDNDSNAGSDGACCSSCVVYHTASVFGPSDNHVQTAMDNVQGTEDVLLTLAEAIQRRGRQRSNTGVATTTTTSPFIKLILTSSMAAVRGTNQIPQHSSSYYTCDDWNTVSKLGESWGSSYQWSKAESERRAWHLAQSLHVPMVSLCPSFIFGPPRHLIGYNGNDHDDNNSNNNEDAESTSSSTSKSYSITLVEDWIQGKSPVQSRLCVDVRDVARAHVAAAQCEHAIGCRFLVSTDARIPSAILAQALQEALVVGVNEEEENDNHHRTNERVDNRITFDAEFNGGAIPIGQPEVLAMARLEHELGVTLRPVTETLADMARALMVPTTTTNTASTR